MTSAGSSDHDVTMEFSPDFQFGVSTASFQNERSGARKTDWDNFLKAHPETIGVNQVHPDWWNPSEAVKDFQVLADLHLPTIRIGVEWARIEPKPGAINLEALSAYHQTVDELKARNLKPLLTLNHFSLPDWVARQGGWRNSHTVQAYLKFVALIVAEFPDISQWITLNEPSILIQAGYLIGYWPPEKSSLIAALIGRRNLLKAHRGAYRLIKAALPQAEVGLACHIRWYKPLDPTAIVESLYTKVVNYVDSINWVARTNKYSDFLGVNFYTGFYLDFKLTGWKITVRNDAIGIPYLLPLGITARPNVIPTDVGWPVVPDFFLDALRYLNRKFHKPIIITENGIADSRDTLRPAFIIEHLAAVWKAIQEGVDIRGYYYWTAVDNLEWREGYTKQFGLIACDPVTGLRQPLNSAEMFSQIAQSREINLSSLVEKYVPPEKRAKTMAVVKSLLA